MDMTWTRRSSTNGKIQSNSINCSSVIEGDFLCQGSEIISPIRITAHAFHKPSPVESIDVVTLDDALIVLPCQSIPPSLTGEFKESFGIIFVVLDDGQRSEERRVGKECRSRW